MREAEDFANLIAAQRCNKAKQFLKEIYENNCHKYADALVKVILVKTNRALQNIYKGYYIAEETILNNGDINFIVDSMCRAVRECAEENRGKTVEKAISYIANNIFDNNLYAGSVAEFVGVSASTLSKLFEERLGVTPVQYIRQNRVRKSTEFLLKEDSINTVALKCGFSSSEAYIRAFKKIYGVTPGKYRGEKSEV